MRIYFSPEKILLMESRKTILNIRIDGLRRVFLTIFGGLPTCSA
ncbi:hypothetical protein DU19_0397 [Chlamydia muridarum]|uniref:Uncharacterized protein n=1 Tax=Chlamydia muridarum (strain MoPn / Nigg) TaxID=243161 RepID=Q9PKV1_CHLMU|nr:hypothetical protein TC_0360 [Chlamydia muridarum str. Nigg]KDU80731.1 hypothetical protein DU17_0399 [Chlamydia muridarum]KDU81363.1 hypothetical protein DU18_0399 [Chlamydia muridarum]KDU82296.1 hypothetical protein DU19_0397 [Chlamydia muridarum]KDU83315.1 hypothetical protein DU20_0397 [Chlamydia muridarum]